VRAVTCFPPGAPFVGCLLLLSVMADWSWLVAVLTTGGVLLCLARAVPGRDDTPEHDVPNAHLAGFSASPALHSLSGLAQGAVAGGGGPYAGFWPADTAGRLACLVLTAMGLLAPLAMMLGAF
ncbi:MAG: hypothetical protein ABF791_12695, partial [Acetobacter sp.]